MDLAEIFRAAGRRWYVLLMGVLVTVGVAFLAFRLVPVTYDIKASVLLLPPAITVEELGGNPFLNLGGLDVAAGVLAKSLTDSASAEIILPPGSEAEYTVQKDASVSGSVLEIAVTDATPAGALQTLLDIQALAETRLQELQSEAAPTSDNKLTMMVVTNNTVAEPNYGSLIRTLIVVGAAGIALSLLSAIAVDSLVRRHKAKRASKLNARAASSAERTDEGAVQTEHLVEEQPAGPDAHDGSTSGVSAQQQNGDLLDDTAPVHREDNAAQTDDPSTQPEHGHRPSTIKV